MLIKIPTGFLLELCKPILEFTWKSKIFINRSDASGKNKKRTKRSVNRSESTETYLRIPVNLAWESSAL